MTQPENPPQGQPGQVPAYPPPGGYPTTPYPQPSYPPTQAGYPPVQPGYPPASAPPYSDPTSAPPGYPPAYPQSAPPGYPYPQSAPPDPYTYGQFGPPVPPPAKKKRGVLIAVLAVIALLVLCGGGGTAAYLITNNGSGGTGQASATDAVQAFMTAVYQDMDAAKAATYVCKDARDKAKLTKKINEIKQQNAGYDTPKYDWTPPKTERTKTNEAILSTTLTLSTANDQVAKQNLRFVATKNNGWWVCEITTG